MSSTRGIPYQPQRQSASSLLVCGGGQVEEDVLSMTADERGRSLQVRRATESPDTTESTTLTWHSASRGGTTTGSPVRILDVQRKVVGRGGDIIIEQTRNSSSGIARQVQASPSQLAAGSANKRWPANQTAKQSSADNLSASFESDYDLLVYLGETETEDLVDTEHSLDYQDQTWRQSICGASLAPTIDESLGDLLLADRTLSRQTVSAASNNQAPVGSSTGELTPTAGHEQFFRSRSALGDKPLGDYPALSDRARTLDTRQLAAPSSTRPPMQDGALRAAGSEWAMTQPVDELDRLLAEMSQSLDLESLAKFDTKQLPDRPSQALSKSSQPAPAKVSTDSILDELDGASRMLEQMISEQAKFEYRKPASYKAAPDLPQGRLAFTSPNKRPTNVEPEAPMVSSVTLAASVESDRSRQQTRQSRPMQRLKRKDSQEHRAPTPPAVDYHDDRDASSPTRGIIEVRACEPSGESDSDNPDDHSDRTKRRTLTGMRSMRAKLSDFVGNLGHSQQTRKSRQASVSPRPPSRSSSIASRNQGKTAEDKTSRTLDQRPSRRDEPSRRSFGQQIRDRLSRSKTRFLNKFMRAQSSPNAKSSTPSADLDEVLFEPGDIARNSDSRDSSLERHLKRDLERRAHKSSESELEGLEETNQARQTRSRRPQRRNQNERSHERPKSLLSLKRLKLVNWKSTESGQASDVEEELRRTLDTYEPTPAVLPTAPELEKRHAPSRTQSLRLAPPISQSDLVGSSVSSLARRLPTQSNSFRPASALAAPSKQLEDCAEPPTKTITPVEPSITLIESSRPAQLDAGELSLREKSAALLGDLRQIFTPSADLPPPPPARPPRRRSKSVVAKAAPTTPPPLPVRPNQSKLATLAQQIRHSAADFFQAGLGQGGKAAKVKRTSPVKAPVRDLCEWKPVVGRQALDWSSPKGSSSTMNLRQQRSLDTDSTWETSDDDDSRRLRACADSLDEGLAPVAAPAEQTAVGVASSSAGQLLVGSRQVGNNDKSVCGDERSWSPCNEEDKNNNKDHLRGSTESTPGVGSEQAAALSAPTSHKQTGQNNHQDQQQAPMRMDQDNLNLLKALSHRRPQTAARPPPPPPPPPPAASGKPESEDENRLSVYENVTAPPKGVVKWLPRPPRPPRPPSPPDSWSVGEPALVPEATEPGVIKSRLEQLARLQNGNQKAEKVPAKPERKLLSMTSIIQEPNDELMAKASTISVANHGPAEVLDSELDDSDQAQQVADKADSSSESSSFANAAENRRRLISRFETPKESKPVRAKFPAFAEGRSAASQSMVKRLARNFDQGASGLQVGRPAIVSTPTDLEEPRSESTWYDAKSIELLDDNEVAELLRELDSEPARAEEFVSATGEPVSPADSSRPSELAAAASDDDATTLDGDATLNELEEEEEQQEEEEEEEDEFRSAADSARPGTATQSDYAADNSAKPATVAPSGKPITSTTDNKSSSQGSRASKIDPNFRSSLNTIIANQASQPSGTSKTDTSAQANRKQHKAKKCRERCGLARYYEALVQRRRRHKNADKAEQATIIEDYIHSSSSSSSSQVSSVSASPASSDDEGQADDSEENKDPKKLSKCSRLYEELERLLVRRSSTLAEEQPDRLADPDQVSLSSSSLSSESIPEVKQRQNLQKLYNIVNEIHSSEAKFVDTLKLLNQDFRAFVSEQRDETPNLIPIEVCLNQGPLRHLPQLQALNENLLEELRLARDHWPKTQKIAHVLVKIGPFLKHYSTYIREFETMQQQLLENMKKYPQFAERIRQFEASDRCQKLSLQHHLLKPIQRIPQYRLLLQQYLHHLKPDDVDYEDTVSALEVVSRVAEHANQSMSEGANFAKLLALQAKIVGRKRADLVRPGRLLIKEGELMKLCRKQVQPRWFVLLSDALLYLTQIQSSDILYLNNELPLDDCQVSTPNESKQTNMVGDQFDTEFHVCTKQRSFALRAQSPIERDDWIQALRRAISEHSERRRSFQPAKMQLALQAQQSVNGIGIELGMKAPLWTPDSRVTMCQLCTSSFSALFRRHHCRACGRVVCSACSSNKAPLIYLKCRQARVCDQCYDTLKANIHLYYLPRETLKVQIGEQELRRLDDHFRSLLKSQFVRHSRLMSAATVANAPVKVPIGFEPAAGLRKSVAENDSSNNEAPGSTLSGYLHRRHPSKPKWKRHWFVIKDKVLYAYRAIDDVAAMGTLPLLGYTVGQPGAPIDGLEPGCLVRLSHQSQHYSGSRDSASNPDQTIEHLFKAESEVAAKRWLEALEKSVVLE